MEIRTVGYDHPDAVKLDGLVQQEYARRYGDEGDVTPLSPHMFRPPNGIYLIAYEDDRPLATGGWRSMAEGEDGYRDGDAEIKRMFVLEEARGQGLARRILGRLESDAREAGRLRMVLETGDQQPEAVALYRSSGYTPVPGFGCYRDQEGSIHMAKPLH
ncbi:GNAT family N-acetyltransferase [Streptomyces sp. NPDC059740]|uniref:GNAT family N-acetyltransferase n=1 Tax=Streptomyces sp. NPDC059740 TaxID=3346926 RepID=UPI003645F6E0